MKAVIQFRNGNYLQSVSAEESVPKEQAKQFKSIAAAQALIKRHAWISYNGGTARPLDPTPEYLAKEVVIEFRNGSFFGALHFDNGVTKDQAQRFPSKADADKFMKKHVWIRFNGGMTLPAN